MIASEAAALVTVGSGDRLGARGRGCVRGTRVIQPTSSGHTDRRPWPDIVVTPSDRRTGEFTAPCSVCALAHPRPWIHPAGCGCGERWTCRDAGSACPHASQHAALSAVLEAVHERCHGVTVHGLQ